MSIFNSRTTQAAALLRALLTLRNVYTLTDAATITINATLGSVFAVTIAGNRTFAAPTNPSDGQRIEVRIKQDGTGSRTITWNSVFRFTGGTAPTLTTTAAKTDYVRFTYNEAATKWDCTGTSLNL